MLELPLFLLVICIHHFFCVLMLKLTCDEDGILLLEVNRMLRAGGYFVWAAQPVYKHEEVLEEQWEGAVKFFEAFLAIELVYLMIALFSTFLY